MVYKNNTWDKAEVQSVCLKIKDLFSTSHFCHVQGMSPILFSNSKVGSRNISPKSNLVTQTGRLINVRSQNYNKLP